MALDGERPGARQAILDATEGLLQDRSLDAVGVADILAAAGVSRATFYFYFANKDDVLTALLDNVMGPLVSGFVAIISDEAVRHDPVALRAAVAQWLALPDAHRVVARSAVESWPTRPELRRNYLLGHEAMHAAIVAAIEADRAAGRAVDGPPSALLASGWIWMMERTWHEALGDGASLPPRPELNDALGATLAAALHGRSPAAA